MYRIVEVASSFKYSVPPVPEADLGIMIIRNRFCREVASDDSGVRVKHKYRAPEPAVMGFSQYKTFNTYFT